MAAGEIAIWLAKLLGGEAIKNRLNKTGLKSELRSLKKALTDSQNRRDELEDAARIVAEIANQRDAYFREIVALRVENAALREELAGKQAVPKAEPKPGR